MKPKNKKIMTVGLALSAIGIWIPQIFVGVVEPRSSERMDVPNGDGAFDAAIEQDQTGTVMGEEFMALPAGRTGAMKAEAAAGEETSFKSAMTSVAGRLERRSERPKRVNLDDLLSAFRIQETDNAAKPKASMGVPQPGEDHAARSVRVPEPSILEDFCASASLSAVIQGDAQVLGMLNGRLVRKGDLLAHGIEVVGFEKRSVLLQRGEQASSVGLPSFQVTLNSASHATASAGAAEMGALVGESESADAASIQGGQNE